MIMPNNRGELARSISIVTIGALGYASLLGCGHAEQGPPQPAPSATIAGHEHIDATDEWRVVSFVEDVPITEKVSVPERYILHIKQCNNVQDPNDCLTGQTEVTK
jgi:hypothetical protein